MEDSKEFVLTSEAKEELKTLRLNCQSNRKCIFDDVIKSDILPQNVKIAAQNLITAHLQLEFLIYNILIDSEDE